MCATIGGTRSSRGGLVSANGAMRSKILRERKRWFSSITFGIIAQRRYGASGFVILSFGFHYTKSLAQNHSSGL